VKLTLMDDFRQLFFYPEFRIGRPVSLAAETVGPDSGGTSHPKTRLEGVSCTASGGDSADIDAVLAEIAIGLWDIARKLRPEEGHSLDRKQRLIYRRATKGIETLARIQVTIDDPTGKRYMQGSEGFMKPIELQPTAGITREIVTETVVPIIYREERIIRRGEVFVAVPLEQVPARPSATSELGDPPTTDDSVDFLAPEDHKSPSLFMELDKKTV
jgi:hypothetical protein